MNVSDNWKRFYKLNSYYHNDLEQLAKHLIPRDSSVLEFGAKDGELLSSLPNKNKLGVELQDPNLWTKLKGKRFDYILLSHTVSEVADLQKFLQQLKTISHQETRIIVVYFNFLWKPLLDLAERIGFKMTNNFEPNWLSSDDIDNIFYLESFNKVKAGNRFLVPYNIPLLSDLFNKFLSPLPLINSLTLTGYCVYRAPKPVKDYSVSILIPARNESGHMRGVLKKIPRFGTKTEVVFVEGHSKDDTYQVIADEIQNYKGPFTTQLHKQKGMGKGDAVRLGFAKAKNEILMILDADLTVDPSELPKFYDALVSNKGDFIMGSRLVYPMEKQAMRNLNYLGNKFFSWAFSFLLDQKIKDTLCGTKVLYKSDYQKIADNRKYFGDFDPFGDYDLIFGAAKLNLKIVEIPIRYKERYYGTTNISRFRHGALLFKMVAFAAKKFKFI